MKHWQLFSRAALLVATVACASIPETHFYRLSPAVLSAVAQPIAGTLSIEPFESDSVYSDDRIVYRTSPYRLDYYDYHHWTSPPSLHVTDYLRNAYGRTGLFKRVVVGAEAMPEAVLSGRVTAFDEVDESQTSWAARLELELYLEDARTRRALWSQRYAESEPIKTRNPEGLAVALSAAMARVVQSSAPAVAHAMQIRGEPDPQPDLPPQQD
jgi:ABC-type uncharacterized transport system auxiliary subunit